MNNSKAIVMEIEHIFKEEALKYNLSNSDINQILDKYVTVQINTLPQFLFFIKNDEASSYKPYNIIINFKDALRVVFETLVAGFPEKPINIVLAVVGFICNLTKLSKINLDSSYANIILYLHENNAYNYPIKEESIYHFILGQKSDNIEAYHKMFDAISFLEKLKVIDIEEGMIRLKEKVFISK